MDIQKNIESGISEIENGESHKRRLSRVDAISSQLRKISGKKIV